MFFMLCKRMGVAHETDRSSSMMIGIHVLPLDEANELVDEVQWI